MKIFLATIIFSFFAVFAPNSHGDRPLLHAPQKSGEFQFLDFKLPIGFLQKTKLQFKSDAAALVNPAKLWIDSTITFFSFTANHAYKIKFNILNVQSCPLIFCEVLQV